MKIKILLLALLLLCLSAQAQLSYDRQEVHPDFEYLHQIVYNIYDAQLENKMPIVLEDRYAWLSLAEQHEMEYVETLNGSYYDLVKRFYANGNIKEKGVEFAHRFHRPTGNRGTAYAGIPVGVWFHYSQEGDLLEGIDHDYPFRVSLEEALTIVANKEQLIAVEYGTDIEPAVEREAEHILSPKLSRIFRQE